MRHIRFTPEAWEQYTWWQGQDRKTLQRINALIQASSREPFAGIGKPEALRGSLSGFWSRRIDHVHRLVYCANDSDLVVIACRYHYGG